MVLFKFLYQQIFIGESYSLAMDDLAALLYRAKVQAGLCGLESMGNELLERRMACDERGYHRVDSEPSNPNPLNHLDIANLMICYDCELFFGKYDGTDVPYIV